MRKSKIMLYAVEANEENDILGCKACVYEILKDGKEIINRKTN